MLTSLTQCNPRPTFFDYRDCCTNDMLSIHLTLEALRSTCAADLISMSTNDVTRPVFVVTHMAHLRSPRVVECDPCGNRCHLQ